MSELNHHYPNNNTPKIAASALDNNTNNNCHHVITNGMANDSLPRQLLPHLTSSTRPVTTTPTTAHHANLYAGLSLLDDDDYDEGGSSDNYEEDEDQVSINSHFISPLSSQSSPLPAHLSSTLAHPQSTQGGGGGPVIITTLTGLSRQVDGNGEGNHNNASCYQSSHPTILINHGNDGDDDELGGGGFLQRHQQHQPSSSLPPPQSQPVPRQPPLQQQPTLQEPRQSLLGLHSSILSIIKLTHGPYGLSYFNHNVFYVGETDSLANLGLLIEAIEPHTILSCAKPSDTLNHGLMTILQQQQQQQQLQLQQQQSHNDANDGNNSRRVIPMVSNLSLQKMSNFDYQSCFAKLDSLNVNNYHNSLRYGSDLFAQSQSTFQSQHHQQQQQQQQQQQHGFTHQTTSSPSANIMRWACILDLTKTAMVMSLSGLLTFIIGHYTTIVTPQHILQQHPTIYPHHHHDFLQPHHPLNIFPIGDPNTNSKLHPPTATTTTITTSRPTATTTTTTTQSPPQPTTSTSTTIPTLIIKPIPSTNILSSDEITRHQLNIFMTESNASGRTKEGLSIFSLLSQTKTKPGLSLLKQWLLYPSTDINVIQDRLDHVQYFVNTSQRQKHQYQHHHHQPPQQQQQQQQQQQHPHYLHDQYQPHYQQPSSSMQKFPFPHHPTPLHHHQSRPRSQPPQQPQMPYPQSSLLLPSIRKLLSSIKDVRLCFHRIATMSADHRDVLRITTFIQTFIQISQLLANLSSMSTAAIASTTTTTLPQVSMVTTTSNHFHSGTGTHTHPHTNSSGQFNPINPSITGPYDLNIYSGNNNGMFKADSNPPTRNNPNNKNADPNNQANLPRLLHLLSTTSTQNLTTIYQTIATICDLDTSVNEKRFVVYPQYDHTLTQLCTNLDQIDAFLMTVLQSDLHDGLLPVLPPHVSIQYVYIPYRGFFFSFAIPPETLPPSVLLSSPSLHPSHPISQQQQQQQQQPPQRYQFDLQPPPPSASTSTRVTTSVQSTVSSSASAATPSPLPLPLLLPLSSKSTPPSILDITAQHGMIFAFSPQPGEYLYITPRTDILVREIGDLYAQIREYQHSIFIDLCQFLYEHRHDVLTVANLLSELDVYSTFATVAIDMGFNKPVITSECELEIVNGKHPILDILLSNQQVIQPQFYHQPGHSQCDDGLSSSLSPSPSPSTTTTTTTSPMTTMTTKPFYGSVPNSISIGSHDSKIHIIAGPNQSGKSITLQTFGIIAYLAHIGSFVPAQYAKVGVCDRIISRHHIQDSINNSISTFAADMSTLSYIINNATEYSLILLDEIGVGTTNNDAMGLLAGIVSYFKQHGAKSPKILMSTHFHDLLTFRLLQEDLFVRFHTVSSLYTCIPSTSSSSSSSSPLQEEIIYLYKLIPGWHINQLIQHGFMCAHDAGLPTSLLSRARLLTSFDDSGTNTISTKTPTTTSATTILMLTQPSSLHRPHDQKMVNVINNTANCNQTNNDNSTQHHHQHRHRQYPVSLLYFLLGEYHFERFLLTLKPPLHHRTLTPPLTTTPTVAAPPQFNCKQQLPRSNVIIHNELQFGLALLNDFFHLVALLKPLSTTPSLLNHGDQQIAITFPPPQLNTSLLAPQLVSDITTFIAKLTSFLSHFPPLSVSS